MHLPILPTINASLNASAGVFLLFGGIAIKNKDHLKHRYLMIGAFFSSAIFLCSYLYYHITSRGISHYQGKGILKPIYLLILGTHSILAVVIVPFILMAIYHALKGNNNNGNVEPERDNSQLTL